MSNQPIAYASLSARPPLANNRRGGLVALGIVSILLGVPSTLLTIGAALAIVRLLLYGGFGVGILLLGVMGAVQLAAATLFIWTGVDSIRCRRWVRPVVIALGWPTLVTSALMVAGLILLASDPPPTPSGPPVDPDLAAQPVFAAVISFVFGVLVPATFLAFYTSKAVRETLAAYDPRPSWTERAPLPVFVGSASLVLFGLFTVALAVVGAAPLFGVYVTGPAAALLCVAAGAVMIASAILLFRGRASGWWLALGVVVAGFTSAIVTFARLGMIEFYRHGSHMADADEIRRSPSLTGVTPIVFVAIVFAISVGYLIWMRKWLTADTSPPTAVDAAAPPRILTPDDPPAD